MHMYFCLLWLNDAAFRGLMTKIKAKHKIAEYLTSRTEIRNYPFQAGPWRLQIDNPFQNRILTRIVICLVDARAFNWNYAFNPYAFQKKSITSFL